LLATWAITSVFSSLSTGVHVLVARRQGEQDFDGAGAILNNALFLALVLGLAVGAAGALGSRTLLGLFASDPAVADAGTAYMQWRFLGLPLFMFVVTYRGFFNGIGDTKVFMYSAILVNISNITFDYLLIFGALGFPRMGLAGAGFASTISNGLGWLFFVAATFLPRYRRRYRYYARIRYWGEALRTIVRLSAPVSFQNILLLLGFLIFVAITGVIGTAQQAASQVVITALFMSFLPCFGFGIGAQTLVGQSIGNGHYRLAHRYGLEAARLATYFTVALGLLFIAVPDFVITLITNDHEVAVIARPLLRIAGAAQIFYAGGIVLAHALQAAGATVYVMVIEVLTHWIVFLPASYLLGVVGGGGVIGAWTALPVYIVAYTVLIATRYRKATWLLIKV
jgi:MATE family multidrug resistance protein